MDDHSTSHTNGMFETYSPGNIHIGATVLIELLIGKLSQVINVLINKVLLYYQYKGRLTAAVGQSYCCAREGQMEYTLDLLPISCWAQFRSEIPRD